MSALAGAIAAVVALIAYLVPPSVPPQPQTDALVTTPTPQPPPDPGTTQPEPPAPSPSPESDTPQPPVSSPTRVVPDSSPLPPAVQPGCDEAATALTAYRRNAGTTRGSQAAAAHQAYLDLMGAVLNAQGVVGATISRLAAEFQELNFRLTGMTGGDPNQVITDINTDLAELKRLCGST
ncbi:hypothetical protein IMZ11_12985 [Microtetraspora sp. AC03309]|uniref:hypothetical protein n=1 Tax=Microtetraspora sp. AC03309 TaxID=2779376 RepID=UPI001E4592E3|nr:hypothetical protein [Microtetraspora sp. AC03309]MCC5576545.1 hypothetical protein [Microtetraspora sp. AC03309]